MNCRKIIAELKARGDPDNVAGMARYGINTTSAVGVSVTALRKMAKSIGRDHELANRLWQSGIHGARILATLVAEPKELTRGLADKWVADLDSWDVCDLLCNNLLVYTDFAWDKAAQYTRRRATFVKRAGFTLIACLAVHDKSAADARFIEWLGVIAGSATDERNYVKKAVNWALRQIGKRNASLNEAAIAAVERIGELDSKSARWITSDAMRELTNEKVRRRVGCQI